MEVNDGFDMSLLKSSLAYHGPQLIEEIEVEQQISVRNQLPVTSANCQGNSSDEFSQQLVKFVAKKADLLFAKDAACNFHWPTNGSNAENYYAILPPLEHFMEVPKSHRRQHFLESIEKGNHVVGVITAVQETGLLLTVLTVETGQIRDLDQTKVNAFCPLREIPRNHSHENVLESFSIRDKVRAVVLSVQEDKLIVSLQPRNLGPSVDLQLGLVNDEELPLHYRRLAESMSSGGKSYESFLRQVLEFHNPSNVSNLTSMFDIKDSSMQPSLMRGLFRVKYNEEDFADRLRKSQSYRLAMRSVGEGVKYFKRGEHLEAMQLFNRALQIDTENIEALVARGALYANCESYRRAIADFEEAIRLNPTHSNAKKYLHQTLTAFAYNLMDKEAESAARYARRAVELAPNNEETVSLLKQILKRMEPDREVSPSGSESGQDIVQNQSLIDHAKETLLRMIEEDQSGRTARPKSRNLSSEVNEGRTKRDRGFSTGWNDQSPQSRREGHSPGGNLSPESKRFLKAMMTSGHPARDPLPLREPLEAFGPALPPSLPVHRSSRRKMTSRRSSSSSQDSSRSHSSSSFSSSSSRSAGRNKSKERSSRRLEDRRKSAKNKKQKRSSSRDKSTQRKRDSTKTSGSSNLKSGTTLKLEKNSSSRKQLTFTDVDLKRNRQDKCSFNGSPGSKKREVSPTSGLIDVNRKRNRQEGSPDRKRRKLSPTLEKSRRRTQETNKKSEHRRSLGNSSGKKTSMANVKRNSNIHEYSSKAGLINYSTSSSSSSRSDKSPEAKQKLDAEQKTKETSANKAAAPGETLQDLEQFLQELKAKKKAMNK